MKRIYLITTALLLMLLSCSAAFAADVDRDKARLVAEKYISFVVDTFHRWDGTTPDIASVEPVNYDGVTVFWLVRTTPTGYLLVSSRDELSPVKVYSDDGTFDPAQVSNPSAPESWIIPEQFQSVEVVSAPVRTMSDEQSAVAARISAAWKMFESNNTTQAMATALAAKTASEFVDVGPFIQATWDQGDPYNRQCPLVDGERTIVGCVATAWSQLLRHWQWPDRGVGSHTNTFNGVDYTVNFAEQTWDWASMTNVVSSGSAEAIINEVAKLCYQVGVAADMDWGLASAGGSGSNAFANDVLDVYFKYKDTMVLHQRSNSTAEEWFAFYKTEFDAATPRPIVMSIYATTGGGHEILADGYQTGITDMVHLNMGWAGSDNAYYDVTSDFVAGYSWRGDYQQIVVGIEPDYSQRESTTLPPYGLLLQ